MVLYVNSCVRDGSRTDRLAKALLAKLGEYRELKLDELALMPLDNERLRCRTEKLENGSLEDEGFALSRQFAEADTIVIAAPYWDGSFPSLLKIYFENIYVTGIVSEYGSDGRPHGLCRAEKLYYVTTAGGPYNPQYSYAYVEDLAQNMFGIKETELLYVENMDIVGNDPEKMLTLAIDALKVKV